MKWKKIIENSTLNHPIFQSSLSYSKTDEDGNPVNYNYTVSIPDTFANMVSGQKKVPKWLKKDYENYEALQDLATFYTFLTLYVTTVAQNFKYKWGALIDSNTLYFNPLWNVDGTEKETQDMAKRERHTQDDYGNNAPYTESIEYGTDTLTKDFGDDTPYTESVQYGIDTNTTKYGNNVSYTESMQYGLDETTHTNGARTETTDHKTNPFNDTGNLYNTSQDVLGTLQYDDKDSRAIHTDTATFNPHTDVVERSQHTDTTTYNPHTDVETRTQHTDTKTHNPHTDKGTVEDYAHKDIITRERHGNIGVTKSTDLLESYRNLPTEFYTPFLNDWMSILSRGY